MNRDSMPLCTVAVCTRNRPSLLKRCLSSLRHIEYPSFEILVVDNAPNDDRGREIAREFRAGYVVEPKIGLSHARNHALACSQSQIIAFIDDDATCDPNWLTALLASFEDPSVAAVTGRILPCRVNTEAERLCARMCWLDVGDEARFLSLNDSDWFEAVNSRGIGFGGNMALRRSAITPCSAFDTRLGRGTAIGAGEENYLFLQLVWRGYTVRYEPTAVVFHPYPENLDELRALTLRSHSATFAYYVLLCEHRQYRRQVLRHFRDKLTARNRQQSLRPINGRLAVALARWRGLLAYVKTRRSSQAKESSW